MQHRNHRIECHVRSNRADAARDFVPLLRHGSRAKVDLWDTAKAETTSNDAQDAEKRLIASRSRNSLRPAVAGLRLARKKKRWRNSRPPTSAITSAGRVKSGNRCSNRK